MRQNHRILLAAAAMLGLSSITAGNVNVIRAPMLPTGNIAKLSEIETGEASGSLNYRWPFNGKNRSQRASLRGSFFAQS